MQFITEEKNTCALCNQAECAQWTCKKLQLYEGTTLPKNNIDVRMKLGRKLLVPMNGIIERRDKEDDRSVLKSLPKKESKQLLFIGSWKSGKL